MVNESKLLWLDKRILLLIGLLIQTVTSSWEYAISTKKTILFYDAEWNEIIQAGHQYKELKSLTYDVVHDVLYFIDRNNQQSGVYMMKLDDDGGSKIVSLINRTGEHAIEDIVYDFHGDALYWSDSQNKKIVKLSFDRSSNLKWTNTTFIETKGEPKGLEVDFCHRKLYYTIKDSKSSLNVISIKSELQEIDSITVGTSDNHYSPVAIAMDYDNDRIYIADNREFNMYSIDSIKLNGTEFRTEIKDIYRKPRSIAVDDQFVYYLDAYEDVLRKFSKTGGIKKSENVLFFKDEPTDIIIRKNYIVGSDKKKCQQSKQILEEKVNEVKSKIEPKMMCLHGGSFDAAKEFCMCTEGHDGQYCEINLCYNYCLNGGDCWMENKIHPKCSCKSGYIGDHCERDVCSNYCLNQGSCNNIGNNPTCKCSEGFTGDRCQSEIPNRTEPYVISEATTKTTTLQTQKASKIPDEDQQSDEVVSKQVIGNQVQSEHKSSFESSECPSNSLNVTYIILGVCFTLSLLIFLIILIVIKKFSRPARPKIRKKYVVHKNIEPLTSRPTTEQCEVIIEDCCNMNICETPCFDPKILQQEINEGNISVKLTSSKRCSSKEDKQDLLKNMEYNQ